MAGWLPSAGNTLLIPSGPAGKQHLFIILNDPVPLEGYPGMMSVLVCMCSIQNNLPFDTTCVLDAGSHPFVTHATYVDYRYARIEPSAVLAARVADGTFTPHQRCTPELLAQIKAGLNTSRFTKRAFKGLPI